MKFPYNPRQVQLALEHCRGQGCLPPAQSEIHVSFDSPKTLLINSLLLTRNLTDNIHRLTHIVYVICIRYSILKLEKRKCFFSNSIKSPKHFSIYLLKKIQA